jgi:hypothetical protein
LRSARNDARPGRVGRGPLLALSPVVSRWIVGDRFICLGHRGWRDLVTGARVRVDIRVMDHDPRPEAPAVDAEGPSLDSSRAIDRGRVGVNGWFEAYGISRRDQAPHQAPRPARCGSTRSWPRATLPTDLVSTVLREARRQDIVGIRTVAVPSRSPTPALELASPLRRLGFVVIRARIEVSAGMRAALAHRHLAIVVSAERERVNAARWVEHLTRVSSRGHLVIDTRRPVADAAFGGDRTLHSSRDAGRRGRRGRRGS